MAEVAYRFIIKTAASACKILQSLTLHPGNSHISEADILLKFR